MHADHRVRNSAHKYKHLPAKKLALANSFYSRTGRDWNILKVEVKLAPSPAAFKARLLQIHISCAALATPPTPPPLPPPPWRDTTIVRTATYHTDTD